MRSVTLPRLAVRRADLKSHAHAPRRAENALKKRFGRQGLGQRQAISAATGDGSESGDRVQTYHERGGKMVFMHRRALVAAIMRKTCKSERVDRALKYNKGFADTTSRGMRWDWGKWMRAYKGTPNRGRGGGAFAHTSGGWAWSRLLEVASGACCGGQYRCSTGLTRSAARCRRGPRPPLRRRLRHILRWINSAGALVSSEGLPGGAWERLVRRIKPLRTSF